MLYSLFPGAHRRFLSLPLLGFVADGFDDWLASNGLHPHSFWFARKLLPDHAHRYNFFINYHEFRRHLRQQQSENQFGFSAN
jgi:hypothetical protein